MSFYEDYKKLRRALVGHDIIVLDHNPYGCSTSLLNAKTIVIMVHPELSFKDMIFTLCHEVGHYFKVKNNKLIRYDLGFYTEEEANLNAINIFKTVFNKDRSKEYFIFYEKIKKKIESNQKLKKIAPEQLFTYNTLKIKRT